MYILISISFGMYKTPFYITKHAHKSALRVMEISKVTQYIPSLTVLQKQLSMSRRALINQSPISR